MTLNIMTKVRIYVNNKIIKPTEKLKNNIL